MSKIVHSHRQLAVFNRALDAAVRVHTLVKTFPLYERRNLGDQILRSSRSVPANLAEAWRKRRYINHFVSKLADVQAEAAETQVWLEFACRVGYLNLETFETLFDEYDHILAQISIMTRDAKKWTKP